jgi:molybdenum cofactor biosynthesis protein A
MKSVLIGDLRRRVASLTVCTSLRLLTSEGAAIAAPFSETKCLSRIVSKRGQSSIAAEADAEDPEGTSRYRLPDTRGRSRLHALRSRLKEESRHHRDIVAVTKTALTQRKPTEFSSVSSKSPTVVEPPPASKLDLRALVDSLPNVEPNQVLTDTFQRQHTYLRLSLTERCNLRCTYCMPEAGVPLQPASHLLQTPELLNIATYFRQAGVTKFRLTGGEPTLRKDLLDVVKGLKRLDPHQIGMTSNGIKLHKELPDLVEEGLDSLNISLDTVDADKFATLTRRPAAYLDRVWQSIDVAHDLLKDHGSVKLNCVVMRGTNDDEVANFIRLTETYPALSVRFIEYMPFSENGWNWDKCVPYQELLDQLETGMLKAVPVKDPHDTTKWFRTASGGKIGFITSMSSHFCAGCNRIRLAADGSLKVCLFDGVTEISLRDAVRDYDFTDTELGKLVHYAIQKKKFSLGGHKDPQDIMNDAANNRPMTLIGG